MRDRVLAFVRQSGPCLPVEVKVSGDSFLAKAYLEELVEKGLLKKTEKKVGESFIYFASGQEEAANSKLASLGVKKTARIYATKEIEVTPEIAKKREEFDSRLKKIEAEEKKVTPKLKVSPPESKVFRDISKARERIEESVRKFTPKIEPEERKSFTSTVSRRTVEVIPKKPLLEAAREAVKRIIERPKENVHDDFIDKAISFLTSKNIEILQKEEKSKSADLVVSVPSAVGSVKFFIKIKSKKKISKSELVAIYAEALEQRMPAILLTNGELAETSKKYLKDVGGFLRVKVF